jgi:NAD(P)-dependent dehydrogenase (short-subunit alcohol dehydrogenase family)
MKVAIVTGGSRGIGRSTAREIARRGMGVILTYQRDARAGAQVAAEIRDGGGRAVALELDQSRVGSFGAFRESLAAALHDEWHRADFDCLVNNAGIGQRALIADTTEETFDRIVAVNLKGPFFLSQALLPLMVDGGHVVNVSSALSRVVFPGTAVYAGAKAALETFTRAFAKEYAGRRIRVNAVAPGAIDSEFGGGKGDAAARQRIADLTALGRLGEADDIGQFIAALVSDDGRFVNAQRIEVSGGIAI